MGLSIPRRGSYLVARFVSEGLPTPTTFSGGGQLFFTLKSTAVDSATECSPFESSVHRGGLGLAILLKRTFEKNS